MVLSTLIPMRFKKVLLAAGIIVILFAIGGFLAAPPLIKARLERQLPELLHRPVHIESIHVNPFALSVTVRGLEVGDRDGAAPFAGFDVLYVRLSGFASLIARAPVAASVRLEGPRVRIVRNPDGTYNFSDLLDRPPSKPSDGGPLRCSLNNIRISGGRVEFDDQPMHAKHEVTDVRVGIPFLSNFPGKVDIDTEPEFSARVDGRPVGMHGKARPFSESPEMALDWEISGLDLPKYMAYLPSDFSIRIPAGTLEARGSLVFKEPKEGGNGLVLSGRFTVNGLELEEKSGGVLARFPRVEVHLISADIFRGRCSLGYLAFQAPDIYLVRAASGDWNFQDLLPASPSVAAGEPAFRLSVSEIAVTGGTLRLDDQSVHPAFKTVLKSLDINVTSFDSGMGTPMGVAVRFATDSGGMFKDEAVFTPKPLDVQGVMEASGVRLGPLDPYWRPFLPIRIGKGILEISTRYALHRGKTGLEGTFTELSGSVSGLSANLPGGKEPVFKADAVAWKESALDIGRRTVQLGGLSFDGARLSMTRNADGTVDLMSAIPPPAPAGAAKDAGTSWQVGVARLDIGRSIVQIEDLGASRPSRFLMALKRVEAADLSTRPGTLGHIVLHASLNDNGALDARGSLGLNPPSLDWTLEAKGLPLMPFEPYVSDSLEIQLTGGAASAKGRLAMNMPPDGEIQGSFEGDFDVTDLSTVDKAQMQDFLEWKLLHLGSVSARSSPPGASIKEAALSDFYSRLIMSAEGKLNLAQILSARGKAPQEAEESEPWDQPGPDEEPAPPEPPHAEQHASAPEAAVQPFALTIESVTLAGGTINYTDHYIKPNYNANMTEVAGRISGLSSDPATRADLEIRAHLDHQAPIEISGKLNPLARTLFLDIKGKATDIELSPLSPYSGKFAGYVIEKGKLNVDVSYLVENGKLKASNHIFLDQFTLGDKVESKDATRLPVRLAIALLKDRQGRIDLDLPVSGSLNDPKFKIGRVILRIFVNLITKAVTSPFALLGSLFGGGGETLSFVEFEPGRAVLDAAGRGKVEQLGKALADRPGLSLDVAGRFDPEGDREGLKKAMLDQRMKAEKMKALLKAKAQAPPPDEIAVDPREYPDLLFRAYKAMKFPKPRTVLGAIKELPVPEMETLMLAGLSVTDDDLRALAQARAQAVKDLLCRPGAVEASRVFLANDVKPSPEAAKAKPCRVDLTLK
jgi:uncharacterized protein involved in outer membrane biogenesis